MKRCPECRRDYHDDTLSFCLADGTELVYGLSDDEPSTAILHETSPIAEAQTRAQILTTNQTVALPESHGGGAKSGFARRLLLVPVLAAVLVGIGIFGYRYYYAPTGQIRSIAVLPFQNSGGNADSEYLSDGLAESLIYRLSQIP